MGSSKWVYRLQRSRPPELVFATHFLILVVDVKASRPPCPISVVRVRAYSQENNFPSTNSFPCHLNFMKVIRLPQNIYESDHPQFFENNTRFRTVMRLSGCMDDVQR